MEKDILKVIVNARFEDISRVTDEDKKYLQANCKYKELYEKLESLITHNCNGEADRILHAIENLIEDINFESGYYNEKYYKQGFVDGLNIINLVFQKGSF